MRLLVSLFLGLVVTASQVTAQSHGLTTEQKDFIKLFNPKPSNFTMNYMYAPELEPDSSNSVTEFDQHVFDMDLILPMVAQNNMVFSLGLGYGLRYYDYDTTPPGSVLEDDVEELHRISASPTVMYFLNRHTALQGKFTAGAYSNLDSGIKSDDMQYTGHGMIVHNWRNNFQVLAGLGVTEDFGSTDVIPLVGMRAFYQRWHFNVTLPVEAKATFYVNNLLDLYGGAWISGSQYRVRSDSVRDFDVQVRDTRLGLGMNYWLFPDLRVTVEGGALLGDDAFEVKVGGVDSVDEDLENAAYLRVGLGASFR